MYEGLGEANDAFGKHFLFVNIVEENQNTSVGMEHFHFINPVGISYFNLPGSQYHYANLESNVQRIAKGKAKYEMGLLRSIVALSLHIDIDTMSNDKACMVCNPQVF